MNFSVVEKDGDMGKKRLSASGVKKLPQNKAAVPAAAIESHKKNVAWKIRVGACRPGISGPTRPGSDVKWRLFFLRLNK
jgi:hypothetical protein